MKKFEKEDKWLLVSCLQKSIRKGFSDLALEYAEKLYELERSYLLYRLSIIALEDIGLGNVSLVNDFLSTEIKKANIEDKGGKDYVLKVVEDLSNSVKDRTACDLMVLASYKNNILPNDKLEEIFLSSEHSLAERAFASWSILGAKKQPHDSIEKKIDDIELFLDTNKKLNISEDILNIIKNGYKIHREFHFIAIGLLASQLNLEKDFTIKGFKTGDIFERNFNANLVDNYWLIDGIDWHTKNGKSAIYDFCNTNSDTTKYLKSLNIPYNNLASVVGSLLFRAVGHQVDKRLIYASSIDVMKEIEDITFSQFIPRENIRELKTIFNNDLENLNIKIQKAMIKPNPMRFPF